MEKRLIIVLLVPLLMFFKWFDPIVRENNKGEEAYKNKKYKEALNHFKIARDTLSFSDSHKGEVIRVIGKLDKMSSYIQNIKADTLNLSDLNDKHRKQLISEFSGLSKGLVRFVEKAVSYSDKINDKELLTLSQKIVENVKELNKNIIDGFSKNKGSADIGMIFKAIAYTKSQTDLYNSKIGTISEGVQVTPDLEALRYNVASSYYELGDYKNAKNEFERINPAKSNIKQSDLFYDQGNTHFKMKDYERALEFYKKSLRKNPEDVETRQNYELTLEMIKKQKKDKKEDKKDKKQDKKEKDKNKEEQKKDKENKPEDKKDKQEKKQEKQEEQKKDEKKNVKPEQKHKSMLQFIKQNEKKQMKKMLQKNKLLKYGIKKSKKKRKDW